MNYVEWLRVRNCLRIVAIILAIGVVLAVILRISLTRYMSPESWIQHFHQPGTVVTHITLPDGTARTVWDNVHEQTRVVIDDRGYAGKHIVVTEPASRAHSEHDNVAVGSVHVSESQNGSVTTTVIDTNGSVPMLYYMAFADVVALIVAMVLAAPFAREVDGHLEVALTKPVSRTRYALGVIGADVVGIIAASFMTVVALYLCQLLFESARVDFSGVNARAVIMGLAAPLAWYALLCAATTWFNRSYVAVLVAALPVAIVIGALTLVEPTNVVAAIVHQVAWVLSRFDPWTYVQLKVDSASTDTGSANFGLRLSLEILFFIVYGALAVFKWQRVEA
ncbi:MAG: hypothetical protein JO146_02780 [Candidatus Eremiobacteraeota bacterium]|nr:hypothetical protein [Candidatus Eremiobacteraeota bacterium]